MDERITKRLRNSGGEEADHVIQKGSGPTRTFTNIHNPGSARQHGSSNEGEAGVDGRKRTVVNTGDGR
ncbi:MAG: hypothetical protein WAV38_12530 [Xanthobacteraceae bacterium]